MTHSLAQMRKKAEAMKESHEHMHYSNVTHTRDGRDHEDHKMQDMKRDDKDRGEIANSGGVGDMGTADKFNPGY